MMRRHRETTFAAVPDFGSSCLRGPHFPEKIIKSSCPVKEIVAPARLPSLFGLYAIPAHLGAIDVFPQWLSLNCGLLFMMRVRAGGQNWGHSVVASSCDEDAIEVLESMDGLLHGRFIPYDFPDELWEEMKTNPYLGHGCKSRYGWDTVPYDAPPMVNAGTDVVPLGIERLYIVAHPVETS